MQDNEYGDETGEFERKPKIVKDFAKAYMQVRFLFLVYRQVFKFKLNFAFFIDG